MKQFFLVFLNIVITIHAFAQGITKNGEITTISTFYINSNGAIGDTGINKNGQKILLPTLTTITASSVDATTGSSGGNIISDGGALVTARGVCWNTLHNPTIASNITTDGSGTGLFTSTLSSLIDGTTYYVRAYATNNVGTAYGNEVSFTKTTPLVIGQSYQGGVIAYIFQASDLGYVAGEEHGIIAAVSDQSTNAPWGCSGTYITGTFSFVGSGQANTTAILAGCSTAGTAAKICDDYSVTVSGVTYSDWYLPSYDELNIMYLNKVAIGGFQNQYYWSSSELSADYACRKLFQYGNRYCNRPKSDGLYVRAVRTF